MTMAKRTLNRLLAEAALPILARLYESLAAEERDQATAGLEVRVERLMVRMFRQQQRDVIRGLAYLRPILAMRATEAASPLRSLAGRLATALGLSLEEAVSELDSWLLSAWVAGATAAVDGVGEVGISFALDNPLAVAFAEARAAEAVTQINDTTRDALRRLVVEAVDAGWSYDQLSEAIGERFEEMATGGDNPRSRRIAVYEMGNAYEAGSETAVNELVAAGLEMEKAWLSAGDAKVRPAHQANAAQGWIPMADDFGSGDRRPPTDPGCRCTLLYRRQV